MFAPRVEHTGRVKENLTPNWFASVMGTGIVANAAAALPTDNAALRAFSVVVWLAASMWLVVLCVLTALHWIQHRDVARTHHLNPVMAHFYGAPAMAFLTVGAGTLTVGEPFLGHTAVIIDVVLWSVGTAFGVFTAVLIPFLTFPRYEMNADSAFAGWLMPVVPPMVSSATGALLVPHVGSAATILLFACYAMFGLSLFASIVIITIVWNKLAHHKVGAAGAIPTLWIILGPLGQSITATNNLANQVHFTYLSDTVAKAFEAFALVYGLPTLGFALLWACIAASVTIKTALEGLPFSLTWWSFTFPVGTCVTGITGLAIHTGSATLLVMAYASYVGLVSAWLLVAVRTFRFTYAQRSSRL